MLYACDLNAAAAYRWQAVQAELSTLCCTLVNSLVSFDR